jgi:peptidoglycan hydrolase CwlO-like protein
MRLKLLLVLVFGLMLAACSGNVSKEEEALKQEVLTYDSIAFETEKLKQEIEESVEKLDSLINEL